MNKTTRLSNQCLDPEKINGAITKKPGYIRASINNGTFPSDEFEEIRFKLFYLPDYCETHPKSDPAKAAFDKKLEEAKEWLRIELNTYKYPH